MSYATWRRSYYAVEADCLAPENTVDHSIRKWTGLQSRILKKHDLSTQRDDEGDVSNILDKHGYGLEVNSSTCALCQWYLETSDATHDRCADCPLAHARGGVACDETRADEDVSPFDQWQNDANAKPMLVWLQITKDIQKAVALGK